MANNNTEVATVNQSVNQLDNYDLSRPSSLVNLAGSMQKFIEEQKLFSIISGKKFPNVEAWQFAGMSLGIIPVLESVVNHSRYAKDSTETDEYKYEATVRLERAETGQTVGRGTSVCSNKEKTKRYFEEYAIQSMAETRAVGKAYRLMLSFLMKSAGFEATPADEVENLVVDEKNHTIARLEKEIATKTVDLYKFITSAMDNATERKQVITIANAYPYLKADDQFINLCKDAIARFPKEENSKKQSDHIDKSVAEAGQTMTVTPPTEANPHHMTIWQKTQILLLLNNGVFEPSDKDSRVAEFNNWDTKRADLEIGNLKRYIKDKTSANPSTSNAAA
jgi:hypothetical protein